MYRILSVLEDTARGVRDIERMAEDALGRKDHAEYRSLVRSKAALLVRLPEIIVPFLGEAPEPLRSTVEETARDFANRARNAIRMDSTWYMSVLLHPENGRNGQLNDLEALICKLDRGELPLKEHGQRKG